MIIQEGQIEYGFIFVLLELYSPSTFLNCNLFLLQCTNGDKLFPRAIFPSQSTAFSVYLPKVNLLTFHPLVDNVILGSKV